MNSIIPIHFESAADEADVPMLALRRLGLYLDTEAEVLAEVLQVAKRHRAIGVLETLSALHLEPKSSDQDIRHLLERAREALSGVLDDVRTIPVDCNLNRPGFPRDLFVQNSGGFFKSIHRCMEFILQFLRRPVANGAV